MPSTNTDIKWVNFANDGEPQYRIGDAVLMRQHGYGRKALQNVLDNPSYFQSSILFEYANQIDRTNRNSQLEVLENIVDRHVKTQDFEAPREGELVVHVRLGNVKGYNLGPGVLADYIINLIRENSLAVDTVTIVTALHFGQTFFQNVLSPQKVSDIIQSNETTVSEILNLLTKQGLTARLRSHQEIDKDFIFLSRSKILVLGSGHFSLCAAMISSARCFVPPWVKTGSELKFDEILKLDSACH